jgi:hypothetical protein
VNEEEKHEKRTGGEATGGDQGLSPRHRGPRLVSKMEDRQSNVVPLGRSVKARHRVQLWQTFNASCQCGWQVATKSKTMTELLATVHEIDHTYVNSE